MFLEDGLFRPMGRKGVDVKGLSIQDDGVLEWHWVGNSCPHPAAVARVPEHRRHPSFIIKGFDVIAGDDLRTSCLDGLGQDGATQVEVDGDMGPDLSDM